MGDPPEQNPAPPDGSPDHETPARRAADERARAIVRRYGEALRVGDPAQALAVTDAALSGGMTAAGAEARVVAPAMHWIGDLWEQGALTVADEHLATAISDGTLAHLYPRLQTAEPRSRERVLVATVQGELHVLGLRMVADVLEGAGFDVLYLGGDVPPGDMVEASKKHRPVVVALGVTMRVNLPALLGELTALAALADPPRVVLGGQGIPDSVRDELSIRVLESSEEVVAEVERLLHEQPPEPPPPSLLLSTITEMFAKGDRLESTDALADRFAAATLAAADTSREQARRAATIERLALLDPLTGLWNRRGFDDRFCELVDASGGDLAVAIVDVDRLKSINDELGHEVGDLLLMQVARILTESIRPNDFPVRFGGDEFAVLLPGASSAVALEVGERIRAAVEAGATDPPATVSVGVSRFEIDRRMTILHAEQALLAAKAAGRNRVAGAAEPA